MMTSPSAETKYSVKPSEERIFAESAGVTVAPLATVTFTEESEIVMPPAAKS